MPLDDLIRDIEHTLLVYEGLIAGSAGYTRPMLERYGPVEALRMLVESGELQSGFKALRDANRLHESFEQLVVNHGTELFDKRTVEAAQWRLDHPHSLM
ncbi:MAG: hypothetical protein F4X81_15535 [Gammaproteobacteria bacterium]|nr:hypothetical protein [Gammaproteobacteria bacterium]MYE52869.1 hypothetical protein [Gammaproteobacteria bacterium]MYF49761.1 hypothetical protein [Gammaproteobacteria bacterium]MYH16855.1 hypothetical protein [Gammaproteobacteria bacterium]MYK82023.1 hypothetical protein [Gammaproteobacteria bacterium]